MNWKSQYQQAHVDDFIRKYPIAYSDGHYLPPKYPDVRTTNGLTSVIQNFLTWSGHYCNRLNVMGRQIGTITRTEAGNLFDDRKWIKSSTKKGTSDLMASIEGRMICIEIKNENTKDRIRPAQVKERDRVESSGAIYLVMTNVDQFFQWYEHYTEQVNESACQNN